MHPDSKAPEEGSNSTQSLGAERRTVTVVRCDMVDSTALQQRLGIEKFWRLNQQYAGACASVAEAHGAEQVRFTGDGFAFAFGRTLAQEDDAVRAVRFAEDLSRQIANLNPLGTRITLRVAVASGDAVVETSGNAAGDLFLLSGTVLNLSARLLEVTQPEQVTMSEPLKVAVQHACSCEFVGQFPFKGLPEETRVWALTEGAPRTSMRSNTPLIGRMKERDELLGRLEAMDRGQGSCVLISGDPGLGKSKLVDWLVAETATTHALNDIFCRPSYGDLSSSARSAFYPLVDYFQRLLSTDLAESQSTDDLQVRLAERLGVEPDMLELLMPLIRPSGDAANQGLSPAGLNERRIQLMMDYLRFAAEQEPQLLVVEDIQWADSATIALLKLLAQQAAEARILVVMTARSAFLAEPSLAEVRQHVEETGLHVPLTTMGSVEALELIRAHSDERADKSVEQTLVRRAGGVPLYLETLALELAAGTDVSAEHNGEVTEVPQEVPALLWQSLMARLDRLGPAKRLAQIASIGVNQVQTAAIAMLTQQADAWSLESSDVDV